VKVNKNSCCKYIISKKRKAKGNVNSLPSGIWDLVTKDLEKTKVLNAFHW